MYICTDCILIIKIDARTLIANSASPEPTVYDGRTVTARLVDEECRNEGLSGMVKYHSGLTMVSFIMTHD